MTTSIQTPADFVLVAPSFEAFAEGGGSGLTVKTISDGVGSEKTHQTINSLAEDMVNTLYVVPTIKLGEEVVQTMAQKAPNRSVSHIHSSNVTRRILQAYVAAPEDSGTVLVITQEGFMFALQLLRDKHKWRLVMDEELSCVGSYTFSLGEAEASLNKRVFESHFVVGEDNLISSRPDKDTELADLAMANETRSGTAITPLSRLARMVKNGSVDVFLSKKTKRSLQFIALTTPRFFRGFKETVFLAALFEETVLYMVWSIKYRVNFEPHSSLKQRLRDNHAEKAPYMEFYYVLNPGDDATLNCLQRSATNGMTLDNHRQRGMEFDKSNTVGHKVVETVSKFFANEKFLLQCQFNKFGASESLAPPNAEVTSIDTRGQNAYEDYHNVAALAATNPLPHILKFLVKDLRLPRRRVMHAFRIHLIYHMIGRVIRKRGETATKRVVVLSKADAVFLHSLFPAGRPPKQISDLPSYRGLGAAACEAIPTKQQTGEEQRKTRSDKLDNALRDNPEYKRLMDKRGYYARLERKHGGLTNKQTVKRLETEAALKQLEAQQLGF